MLGIPAALALALVVLPVAGLLVRSNLTRLPSLIVTPSSWHALRLSLLTAGLSTLACVLLGVPLAVVLARARFHGIRLLRSIVLLPLVLPPVVGGLALLYLLGRKGFLGMLITTLTGESVPFTTAAVVIAQTFVAMPFLVVSLEGALRGSGDR
ncbi:molybdate ABC transporter permease subunit, partial [Amycolatopsis mediterranei]